MCWDVLFREWENPKQIKIVLHNILPYRYIIQFLPLFINTDPGDNKIVLCPSLSLVKLQNYFSLKDELK